MLIGTTVYCEQGEELREAKSEYCGQGSSCVSFISVVAVNSYYTHSEMT